MADRSGPVIGRTLAAAWLLGLGVSSAGAIDLTGRWLFDFGIRVRGDIVQTGTTLSVSVPVPMTGSVDSTAATFSVGAVDGGCQWSMAGAILMPGERRLVGSGVLYCPPTLPSTGSVTAARCECDDGNTADGDGCNARCQVEPCWTCTGSPSVCVPIADGVPCDDHDPCTIGETCTGSVCSSATPVFGCVNLSGTWHFHDEVPDLSLVTDSTVTLVQRDAAVDYASPDPSRVLPFGAVDPMTRALDTAVAGQTLFCPSVARRTGTVTADGASFTVSGSYFTPDPFAPDHCLFLPSTLTGSRCGDALLDAGEQCDDGNLTGGDGCSATCQVETCYTCAGTPSVCSPVTDGTPCDDGNACTSETCTAGVCQATAVTCPLCERCDPVSGCVDAPLPATACVDPDPRGALLALADRAGTLKDTITWKWSVGAGGLPGGFSDPAGVDFALCVYDESGAVPASTFRALFRGEVCGLGLCWRTRRDGYAFVGGPDQLHGISRARLTRAFAGRPAKVVVRGKGALLSGRPYGLPSPPLDVPVRVQLQSASGLCLEAVHSAPGRDTNERFRASSD